MKEFELNNTVTRTEESILTDEQAEFAKRTLLSASELLKSALQSQGIPMTLMVINIWMKGINPPPPGTTLKFGFQPGPFTEQDK